MPRGRIPKYKTPEERRIAHNEHNKQWRKDNPEKARAQAKRYNDKHRAQRAAYMKKRYSTDPEYRERLRICQRNWQRRNRAKLNEYHNKYRKNVKAPKDSLLTSIKRTNQKIIDLEQQITIRQDQIHAVSYTDRPRVKRALRNLQETLESVTAKRDNYEQLFKENFVD